MRKNIKIKEILQIRKENGITRLALILFVLVILIGIGLCISLESNDLNNEIQNIVTNEIVNEDTEEDLENEELKNEIVLLTND